MYRTNKSIDESAGLLRDLVSSLESLITQPGTENQFLLENTKYPNKMLTLLLFINLYFWNAVYPVNCFDFKR